MFARQWHLKNTGQAGARSGLAIAGQDINVEPVWTSCNDNGTCKGEGITIAVVDRGVEVTHPDLFQNISNRLLHRTYSLSGAPANGDPSPTGTDSAHGTAAAGIIAARDNNGIGGRGVAPRVSLVSYKYLDAQTTSNRVDAMTYQAQEISVSSNSWGPPDGTGRLMESSSSWREAIDYGLSNGRSGRGIIYVFAAGNGGSDTYEDSSNYDGYANYRGVMAVGGLNAQGRKASYTEFGSNIWISAPGGESCASNLAILTTDRRGTSGYNTGLASGELSDGDYTQCVHGTSLATPIVSGVAALILQANPALGWRDVREIIARTARQVDAGDPQWSINAAGHRVHPYYGFGAINATAAVTAARTWTNLPAQRVHVSPTQTVNIALPDNSATGVTNSMTILNSGIRNIEWVDVSFTAADHSYAGDLEITLTSPSGSRIILARDHLCSIACVPYNQWRFGVAHLLNEPADGVWRLTVQDRTSGDTGTFQNWQLTVYGH